MKPLETDLLIVGGGLAGSLVALFLHARRPDVRVTVVEAGPTLGGNHVWSFFDSDLADADRAILAPLVCHSWPDYEVRFPDRRRILGQRYNSIESERLHAIVRGSFPPDGVLTGAAATFDASGATLADGRRIAATGVIDARGGVDCGALDLGWQKFLGRLLRLEAPHGLARPVVMDATVDQADGYRFVYLLPFGPNHVFVEDTYYSEAPSLDLPLLGRRIDDYARAQGWRVAAVEREETAALPIAMGGDFARLWAAGGQATVGRIGMAAALFQPMTGYSLPDAVRTAALIAAQPDLSAAALARVLRAHAEARWTERGFYRLLARMLLRAADPPARWRVLARFYGLGEGLISRFYAGQSTLPDRLRILAGRPPVPLGRALMVLKERWA